MPIEQIVDGICTRLKESFGDGYKIYPEAVKQGLSNPCFFVRLVNPQSTMQPFQRYLREHLFCIQYMPLSETEPRKECHTVMDKLYLALEYIKVDGHLQRGVNLRGEFANDMLHFFVEYNLIVRKVPDIPPMEILEVPNVTTHGKD